MSGECLGSVRGGKVRSRGRLWHRQGGRWLCLASDEKSQVETRKSITVAVRIPDTGYREGGRRQWRLGGGSGAKRREQ